MFNTSLAPNRGLTPSPSPNGEGSDYRDTPIGGGPSPIPSPNGEGSDYRDTPTCPPSVKQPNRGNLTYYAPPCGGGDGGGATSS